MSYLNFDKNQLINLEYSLSRETIRSNRAGSYASTTLVSCHTRKYHGLLVCPIPGLGVDKHVMISSLDETIIQHDKEFHLAVRKYPGIVHPGHKYIREFHIEPIPTVIYRVGGVLLKRERLLTEEEPRTLVRYTLEESHSHTLIRFHPFLAFRNFHQLRKANLNANTKFEKTQNGIKIQLYPEYPYLYMQLSKKVDYIPAPMWFYNVEYIEEQKRGYDYMEDLYVPGFFEFSLEKGESIVFSGGLDEITPASLQKRFNSELKNRTSRNNFYTCLENAAEQFLIRHKNGDVEVSAGFHWYNEGGRDALVATPGLTLTVDDTKTCKAILNTYSKQLKGALFINPRTPEKPLPSIDAPLWYIWAIQQYVYHTESLSSAWKLFGGDIKQIIQGYIEGIAYDIKMQENYLISGGNQNIALTWMDGYINGTPVIPRQGFPVEVNALWYNALCFGAQIAHKSRSYKIAKEWNTIAKKAAESFMELFWDEDKKYLADVALNTETKDWSVRPNQIIAAALHFSPISKNEIKKFVVDKVEQDLLTPRGLRTLSPKNPHYIPIYEGDHNKREIAYHSGTAHPWLLSFFTDAYLKLYEKSGVNTIEKLYNGFEKCMGEHGVGTISEIYDGNPPHLPRGAISQAWCVAALLETKKILDQYK